MAIRIDEDLLNLFDEKCKLETMTKTQIIVKAIKEYVDFKQPVVAEIIEQKPAIKQKEVITENKSKAIAKPIVTKTTNQKWSEINGNITN
jgi:predicted transcriptional regulator